MGWYLLTLALILASLSTSLATQANPNIGLFRRLKNNSDYDDIPPTTVQGQATEVEVDFFVNGISNVKPASMDYWIDVFLTQQWVDQRLTYSDLRDEFVSLPDSYISKLWVPDLFMTKAKQGKVHSITDLSRVLKLNPRNGTLLYSQRIHAQVACTMDLEYFPFDHQNCSIELQSWRYDDDLVKLSWITGSFNDDEQNLAVDEKLSRALPSLGVDTFVNFSENCIDVKRGNFSCLTFYITFYRNISFYIWDIYIPSLLMVVVTWMSFWIDRKIIQGRCALGSLTMVAISNQINSVKLVLPPTSQVKAADVWLWTCQFYVLGAFLEFGIVNYLSRRDLAKQRKAEEPKEAEGKLAIDNSACDVKDEENDEEEVEEVEETAFNDREDDQAGREGATNGQACSDLQARKRQRTDSGFDVIELEAPQDRNPPPAVQETRLDQIKARLKKFAVSRRAGWDRFRRQGYAKQVDLVSRGFFPGTFTIFLIAYWSYYIDVSGYSSYLHMAT